MASSAWFAEAARSARATRSAPHGGVAGTLLAICALASGGFPAHAADGVVEINQECSEQAGCFAEDAAGFPVQITGAAGRSYRLTSDLRVLSPDTTAIEFSGSLGGFTLDLGGFSIRGPVTCSGTPLVCSATGDGDGVTRQLGSTASGITVRNGTISGLGGWGVELILVDECVVEEVVVRENGRGGVMLRHASRVDRVAAIANGGDGIQTGGGSVIVSSVARGNAEVGINSGSSGGHASVVLESSAIENGTRGIETSGASSVVAESTARANGTDGIFVGFSSVVIETGVIGNGATAAALGIYAGAGSRVHGAVIRENVGTGLDFADSAYTDNTISDNTVDAVTPVDGSRGGNLCVGAGVVGPQCP